MSFSWLNWSNPVSLWWIFLVSVSSINIIAWIFTSRFISQKNGFNSKAKLILLLSAGYVFGCAFRSLLPRADVQRICLFDTWFSSVLVGRSVATIAELCFVSQWALVLKQGSKLADCKPAEKLSIFIVPMIFIAEIFSWYGVITTHYLGNTVEESIWAATYSLIAVSLISLYPKFKGAVRFAIGAAIIGCILYVTFMVMVDVPMYFGRWQMDLKTGKNIFGFIEGLKDLNTRWVVTHNIEEWRTEIPWMSLYFSVAVWTSIALCYVPLKKEQLLRHLK